jgi:hypothetical protein
MAQGTVVTAQVMRWLVAIAAHGVQPLEARPAVAGEAVQCGVIALEFHRVFRQRCLIPNLGTGVAVLAVKVKVFAVGTNMADNTVREVGLQLKLQVAVQAHRHGTHNLTCDGVKPVAHLTVAITAFHSTLRTLPHSV